MAAFVKFFKNITFEQLTKPNVFLDGLAYYNLNRQLETQKRDFLLKQFDDHVVTQELKAGPEKASSDVIPEGYGNLYAFLGFNKGTDVVGPVRTILDKQTKLLPGVVSRKRRHGYIVTYNFHAEIPTLEHFDAIPELRPPNWGQKSWVKYIEEGVPNFAYFIFRLTGLGPNSRSGTGLERKFKLRETDNIQPIKYITELVEEFLDHFRRV